MTCNNNGKTFVVSLTTVPGGTAANANYVLALDHYTCGNRKLCVNEAFPVTADLKATAIGLPVDLGNGTFCQEVLVSGSCTYMPYVCGCNCNVCPRTENIYCSICVPCSSAVSPTLTIGTSAASPTNAQPCCNVTNCVAITTSLNVTTGA
jgi:hypothetical protein